jgi:hypothetical protein
MKFSSITITHLNQWIKSKDKLQEVLDRIYHLISFNTSRVASKTTPPAFFHCRENVITEFLPSNNYGDTQTHRHAYQTNLLFLSVFAAEETQEPKCSLTMKRGTHYTEPLSSNGRRETNTDITVHPIAVAERSRARTVFARSNTAIVGSNPTEAWMFVCVFSVST